MNIPLALTAAFLLAISTPAPAKRPTDPVAASDQAPELVKQAWLIHHGIETIEWRSPACKARALELVDEEKLTPARLEEAMRLAMRAEVVQCIRMRTYSPR